MSRLMNHFQYLLPMAHLYIQNECIRPSTLDRLRGNWSLKGRPASSYRVSLDILHHNHTPCLGMVGQNEDGLHVFCGLLVLYSFGFFLIEFFVLLIFIFVLFLFLVVVFKSCEKGKNMNKICHIKIFIRDRKKPKEFPEFKMLA